MKQDIKHCVPQNVMAEISEATCRMAEAFRDAKKKPFIMREDFLQHIMTTEEINLSRRAAKLRPSAVPYRQTCTIVVHCSATYAVKVEMEWKEDLGEIFLPESATIRDEFKQSPFMMSVGEYCKHLYTTDQRCAQVFGLIQAMSASGATLAQMRYSWFDMDNALTIGWPKDRNRPKVDAFLQRWRKLKSPQRAGLFWANIQDDVKEAKTTIALSGVLEKADQKAGEVGISFNRIPSTQRENLPFAERVAHMTQLIQHNLLTTEWRL